MKRYFLNKINKIGNNLIKGYIKPKPMLLVDEKQNGIITNLFIDNKIVKEIFKDEKQLFNYIKTNNIDFVVYGINLDLI